MTYLDDLRMCFPLVGLLLDGRITRLELKILAELLDAEGGLTTEELCAGTGMQADGKVAHVMICKMRKKGMPIVSPRSVRDKRLDATGVRTERYSLDKSDLDAWISAQPL